MRRWVVLALAPIALVYACGGNDIASVDDAGNDATGNDGMVPHSDGGMADATVDGGDDGGSDAGADVSTDSPAGDSSSDGGTDAGADGVADAPIETAPDAPGDAPIEAAPDAPADAPIEAAPDAPADAPPEAAADARADAPVESGADASDGGGIFDAGGDGPILLDGGACNSLANTGPSVPETQVPMDIGNPAGGTISGGLYYLTKWEVYTGVGGASGPTGNTRKNAFYFYPTIYFKVTADNGGVDENDNRTWSVSGTTLTSNQTCPSIDFLTSDYTVSGNLLILFAGNLQLTFTHQ